TNTIIVQFRWSALESTDFRQYIANLRAVSCPEEIIRDIIVAEIDQLYAAKVPAAPSDPPPWHTADRRRLRPNSQAAELAALQKEKRALVKELIGYEWDNSANEIWHEELMPAILLGFLPDLKARQFMAIDMKYYELAQNVRSQANSILIAEDRAQL